MRLVTAKTLGFEGVDSTGGLWRGILAFAIASPDERDQHRDPSTKEE